MNRLTVKPKGRQTSIGASSYEDMVRASHMDIPAGFQLGAATAAYQIEGGARHGGRGASIWDTFSHTPGKVKNGDTGDVAADHFHRWREDIELMVQLGLDAYRFSISWPRIMPDGEGEVNPEGIRFYDDLIDALVERGIKPVVTLNHWDLPQALENRYGGWRGRETAFAFERYAEVVGAAFGDRVAIWSTHNEPWNNSFSGYGSGAFAPGGRSHADALKAVHHLNLSHGLAVQALRRTITKPDALVSVVLNIFRIEGVSSADADAVRRMDAVANRSFTGPMLRGEYPQDLLEDTARFTDWGFVLPGDLEIAHQPLDLLGVNYYEVMHVRENPAYDPTGEQQGGTDFPGSETLEVVRKPELERTGMDWGIEPRGLEDHLLALSAEFPGLPIMVMENGAAFPDSVDVEDGERLVIDLERTKYLADHLAAVLRAKEKGALVCGYYVWSLLDNFEWALGYGPRFGIIHVDYATLERTPKLSARWLATVCESRTVAQLAKTRTSEPAEA